MLSGLGLDKEATERYVVDAVAEFIHLTEKAEKAGASGEGGAAGEAAGEA